MTTATWGFLTNHAHVALCIARDPGIRLRDLATKVGITERAAQRIVTDLVHEGYLERTRVGRRNHYRIHSQLPLRHPLEHHLPLDVLLRALTGRAPVEDTGGDLAGIRARAQRSA
jgi:hypothetical protein